MFADFSAFFVYDSVKYLNIFFARAAYRNFQTINRRFLFTRFEHYDEANIWLFTNGFRKSGLLRDKEDSTNPRENLPWDKSDIKLQRKRENTETTEDDFSSFSDQWLFVVEYCIFLKHLCYRRSSENH